jgi:hypothetical protein
MAWSAARMLTARFGRFAMSAAVLLSISASTTPALATKGVKLITKYPTNQQECDQILDKVLDAVMIETNGEGLAIQHFLIGTNADHVLPKLCAERNYAKAVEFANSIVDGDPQPPQIKNGNQGRDCFMNC